MATVAAAMLSIWLARRSAWFDGVSASEQRAVLQAKTMPPSQAVIFGDSLTARVHVARLCSRPAMNAAISGTRLPDRPSFVDDVIANARPSVVVLAWGANDAVADDASAFLERYDRVVAGIGVPVVIVGLWPVGPGSGRSPAFLNAANEGLRAIAYRHGAVFVPPPLQAEHTDGLHLSTAAGIARIDAIDRECANLPGRARLAAHAVTGPPELSTVGGELRRRDPDGR